MERRKTMVVLVAAMVMFSAVAATVGIFSENGQGQYTIESIRGEDVRIWGSGLYQDMSAEVAPQGIAQDFVTLFPGIPLLIIGLIWALTGSLKGKFLLGGVTAYFFVTYLFYLMMGMYNEFFLIYTLLASLSFFALAITLFEIGKYNLQAHFKPQTPVKLIGAFLIFNSLSVGLMWLNVIVGPMLNGTYPSHLDHYTTLVVQGLDLALLLPIAFVSGIMLIKKDKLGYLLAPVYMIFLSLLMLALIAKIVAMSILNAEVGIPPLVIIPLLWLLSLLCSYLSLISIKKESSEVSM
jgi:hypothetical protein